MPEDLPFVSVVLPAHNEQEYLAECLSSLIRQDYPQSNYEIILVNNNSTDATVDIAKSFDVQVINEPVGPVGRVRNAGAKASRGEVLLFLDSDCVAPDGWISYAAKRINDNPELVIGGGYELRSNPKSIEKYWLLDGKDGATLPKELLGGCIGTSRATFVQAGGFDETVTSGEDSKLSITLRTLGFEVIIDRKMSVVHLGNPTSLGAFFRRQIWHSENYFTDAKNSMKDPTFHLTLAFLFLSLFTVAASTASIKASMFLGLSAASIPLIFSLKRINRSRNIAHLTSIHKIYCIDLTYLLGRSAGLLKGLYKHVTSTNTW